MRKQAPVAAWDPQLVGWLERWAWHCRGTLSVGHAAAGTGMSTQHASQSLTALRSPRIIASGAPGLRSAEHVEEVAPSRKILVTVLHRSEQPQLVCHHAGQNSPTRDGRPKALHHTRPGTANVPTMAQARHAGLWI